MDKILVKLRKYITSNLNLHKHPMIPMISLYFGPNPVDPPLTQEEAMLFLSMALSWWMPPVCPQARAPG